MRIIENRDELQINCKDCNSLLGIEVRDISEYYGGYFFTCLKCKAENLLPEAKIPTRWLRQIE